MHIVYDEEDYKIIGSYPNGIKKLPLALKRAVNKMMRNGNTRCYPSGWNVFVENGRIMVYRWADTAMDITPPYIITIDKG